MFDALKVNVPLPALTRFAVPPPFVIAPEIVLDCESVALNSPLSFIAPAVNVLPVIVKSFIGSLPPTSPSIVTFLDPAFNVNDLVEVSLFIVL